MYSAHRHTAAARAAAFGHARTIADPLRDAPVALAAAEDLVSPVTSADRHASYRVIHAVTSPNALYGTPTADGDGHVATVDDATFVRLLELAQLTESDLSAGVGRFDHCVFVSGANLVRIAQAVAAHHGLEVLRAQDNPDDDAQDVLHRWCAGLTSRLQVARDRVAAARAALEAAEAELAALESTSAGTPAL